MSRCPSSTHNYQPFSQSQKISIGIVVDSAAPPQATKERELSNKHVPAEKETSYASRSTVKPKASYQGTFSDVCGATAPNEALSERGVAGKRDVVRVGKMPAMDRKSENLSSVPKHASVSVSGALQEQDNVSKESLRMKLRQILGTNPLSDDKVDDPKTLNQRCDGMMHRKDVMGDRHRQNSDTIETDSENASLTTKRPVTRSIARNKAPTARKPKSSLCEKQAKHGDTIPSSAKKSMLTRRTGGATKSSGIKPDDVLPNKDVKNIQLISTGDDKPTPVKEVRSCSSMRTPPPHDFMSENIEATLRDVNMNYSPVISEKSHMNHSPVISEKSQQQEESENPAEQENSEHHKSFDFGFQTLEPQDDGSDGPLFKLKNIALNSPMGLFPTNNDKKQPVLGSPSKAGHSILDDKFSSRGSSATENSSYSLDATTSDESHTSAQGSSIEERDADNELQTPIEGEFDRTKEVSSIERDIRLVEKPIIFRNKRPRNRNAGLDDVSPAFTVPTAGEEMDDIFVEASQLNADDGLARVISLLGLALEKVKSKMALATNRRCLDILMSAAEEIHSQLQDVESQIQTDLGNLRCLETSKRKHHEIRLQEQQEQLIAVHRKFKEDIHKYFQDCRGAFEGLETHHVEVRGAIEKQKASHRKLVLQAEAAVENRIVDAQQKVMSVHEMGKKKMQQLKVAVGECLKDVILG